MKPAVASARQLADDFTRAEEAANYLSSKTKLRPKVGLVLGSGLGSFADKLTGAVPIPYADIPHFPKPSAEGHAGNLVIGTLGHVPVACMQGRVHLYEGHSVRDVVFPVRALGRFGVKALILTNAAGGINETYTQGSLVVLKDHINLQGVNPLIGPNDERLGPRFLDMTQAYFRPYRQIAMEHGKRLGIDVFEGVYAALYGPMYETPAEIRYLRTIGADVVGMSTVAEVIAARHIGIRVLGISCVTNMAAGILDRPIDHKEVLETGERVKAKFIQLLEAIMPQVEDLAGS
ncbi:MAG: purine-nucleoside phosphorylase [Acidobacteriia bacterium]|nr:purine-nucleoside phosphorylase [Terriglobia bacterium]